MTVTSGITVGVLHPGAMGVTVAAACAASGVHEVLWCSAGRSPESIDRATAAGLAGVDTLDELVGRSDVIVSVCPPGSAIDVADQVAAVGFDGVFVDANAIAPDTARSVGQRFERFVDGGIIGPPAIRAGITRLYLSGDEAPTIAELWDGSLLDARPIDGEPGAASALKIAYATWTKVSSAMLLAVRALARAEGIEEALLDEWAISLPGTTERSEATAKMTAFKAWRFDGEMAEIAATFAADGLPPGFGEAARDIFSRMAAFKGIDDASLDDVLDAIMSEREP
jgi:3-hydroxyisobutyrate dehydrogenase-like beta-hydroxyacid dehydrogenase